MTEDLFSPEEVAIIDPLYEPLKIHKNKFCPHLIWLSSFTHKKFAVSPHLLFDIEKMYIISGVIEKILDVCNGVSGKVDKENEYLIYRGKVIKNVYHPYIRRIFSIYLQILEQFEQGRLNSADNTSLEQKVEDIKDLNQNLLLLGFFRELILSLFFEMKNEFHEFLHGKIVSFNDIIFPYYNQTLFSDNVKKDMLDKQFSDELLINRLRQSADAYVKKNKVKTGVLLKNESDRILDNGCIKEILAARDSDSITLCLNKIQTALCCSRNISYQISVEAAVLGLNLTNPQIIPEKMEINNKSDTIYYFNGYLYKYSDKKRERKFEKHFIELNYDDIALLMKKDTILDVNCPACMMKNQANPMVMSEEQKIYDLYKALLKSFELRRSKWLYMSGFLHIFIPSATHTRLAHQIGTMIVAMNALDLVKVNIHKKNIMNLGEYLIIENYFSEYICASLLHDIGHAPMSHILEVNPFLKLNHEDVTRNLILGGEGRSKDNWYKTQHHYLKTKYIQQYTNFFHDIYKKSDDKQSRLKLLHESNYVIEMEIITAHEVLKNFGIDVNIIIEILNGKSHCPICGKTCCKDHEQVVGLLKPFREINDGNTLFLHKLFHSKIDFDRIDHVNRDSLLLGLSLFNTNLDDLLGSLLIILPQGALYSAINNTRGKNPGNKNSAYIMISESGMKYFIDLLGTRRIIFRESLFSDQSNWINGVMNMATAKVLTYQPHITQLLPYITDQVVFHLYSHKNLNLVELQKLLKIIEGKKGYEMFKKPYRFKFKKNEIPLKIMKEIYRIFEGINREGNTLTFLPQVIFYSNIKLSKNDKFSNIPEEKDFYWDEEDCFIFGKKFGEIYIPLNAVSEILNDQKISKEHLQIFQNLDIWTLPEEKDIRNLLYVWINIIQDFSEFSESIFVENIKDNIAACFGKNSDGTNMWKFDDLFEDLNTNPQTLPKEETA